MLSHAGRYAPAPGSDAPAAAAAPALRLERPATRAARLADTRLFVALLLLLGLPALVQVFLGPDDHDVAWVVYIAGRVLDGARLYVDLVESNPPLIIALNMPAAWLSRVTGISDILIAELAVVGLIAGSLLVTASLLRQLAPGPSSALLRRGFLLAAMFALAAVPASSNVFAQREHVMVVLLLPYLVASAVRATPRPLASRTAGWTGAMAGVGIALKPFFVLPWLLVEVYLATRRRVERSYLRPENVIIAAVLLGYAALVVLLTPEYLRLALLLSQVYGAFLLMPYSDILWDWRSVYVEHAVLVMLVTRPDGRTRELRRVLALATVGFMGSLLLQHKGWVYHWYPALAGATLLLGVGVLDAVRDIAASRSAAARGGFVLAAIALSAMAANVGRQLQQAVFITPGAPYMRDLIAPMGELIAREAPRGSVAALSSVPFPMFPAVNHTGARWVSRFAHLWALSGPYRDQALAGPALRYHRPSEMGTAERFVYEGVVRDMVRQPPRLLFVLTAPDGTLPHPRFDYIAYFSQDPRFARAMQDYRAIGRIGKYRVYERVATPASARSPAGTP